MLIGTELKGTELLFCIEKLTELVIAQEYLHRNGVLSVVFDTGDEQWLKKASEDIEQCLLTYLEDMPDIKVEVGRKHTTTPPTTPPLPPYPTSEPAPTGIPNEDR